MWIIFLVLLVVGLALPWLLEKRRRPVDAAMRKGAPGQFVELSGGMTHYQWIGPARGPVAVLIHGLTTPSVVWNDLAKGLGDTGYRVLLYDLYGRGYSDAPKGDQDADFFVTQLDELLASQNIADDLTLVGYSMGGSIATSFAATEPHRMKRLILLAPAGIDTTESNFSKYCRTKPIIGDWVYGLVAAFRMQREIAKDAANEVDALVIAAQRAQLNRKGYLRSVLSSRRHMLENKQETEHRGISRDDIPVIAIWGADDSVIPITALGKLTQWNRTAYQEVVEGAGHALPYSHGEQAIAIMRNMLREQ